MNKLFVTILACVAVSSYAVPTPEVTETDVSQYFYHAESGARIVGGSVAPAGSVPYMVGMNYGIIVRMFVCGGSLVSTRHVLTAAHCIDAVLTGGSLFSSLRVTVGTNQWNLGGQSYTIERQIRHELWNTNTIKNDLGFLITNDEVVLSNTVQLVPLNFDEVDGGVTSRVAGWGRIRTGGPISSALLELTLDTIGKQECLDAIDDHNNGVPQRIRHDPELEVCTFHSVNHGVCNGDSGSALVRVDSQQQIGVVSWGYACARGAPDMFVRLSAYKDWVAEKMAL